MSSHNRSDPAHKTGNGPPANLETALRIATVMADTNARLFKLQSDAANAAFAENSRHLKALLHALNTKDPGALLSEWAGLIQANMRRILDITRRCFEMVPQTQAEFANLAGESVVSTNRTTQQYVDQSATAISGNGDAAAATVAGFLARTIESAGTTQPPKRRIRSSASQAA